MTNDLGTQVENVLCVRPFHLFTLLLFLNPGPGLYFKLERTYGKVWVDEVKEKVNKAKEHPNLRIVLGGTKDDFMCEPCIPRKVGMECRADTLNYDPKFVERYGLEYGRLYSVEEIREMNIQNLF